MPKKLTAEQDKKRLELYKQGLTDKKIGEALGLLSGYAIFDWRTKRRLPANSMQGRKKSAKHTAKHRSGVKIENVLPPDGCVLVKTFFRDLVTIARQAGEKENMCISGFIRTWRELNCGGRATR